MYLHSRALAPTAPARGCVRLELGDAQETQDCVGWLLVGCLRRACLITRGRGERTPLPHNAGRRRLLTRGRVALRLSSVVEIYAAADGRWLLDGR
jgi:hypothetical protein